MLHVVELDFPIEILLASGRKNYLNSRQEGKKAHQTRLIVDNFILSQGTKHSIDFYKACHNVGLGRSMIYFLKKWKKTYLSYYT